MLVLSSRLHEKIVIDGEIVITVLQVKGSQVRLGITAPSQVPVQRQEIMLSLRAARESAGTASP